MLVFPQLSTGALIQFPIQRRRRLRTVVNELLDGSMIKLADPPGELTEWRLEYAGLSNEEILALQQFFVAAEGTLNGFTFLSPTENLMAWSDELDHAAWTKDPLLTISRGVSDALGGTNGWHIVNDGAAAQRIFQTLATPGSYKYCFSLYARSEQPATITQLRGSERADRAVGSNWRRLIFSGPGQPESQSVEFGVELAAGVSVEIFGLQVEAQTSASGYKPSTSGGIYPGTHFRDNEFFFASTDVNRHSGTVNLIHANRL